MLLSCFVYIFYALIVSCTFLYLFNMEEQHCVDCCEHKNKFLANSLYQGDFYTVYWVTYLLTNY